MADTSTLLKIAYGNSGDMPSAANALYGTMYVTLDQHLLAFKLPTGSTNVADDLFYINTPHASIANQVNNNLSVTYSTNSSVTSIFNGAAALTVFVGAKPIVGTSTSATANVNTSNTNTYLNILNRTDSSTWVSSGGILLKGAGATSITSSGGVITISSTNTTYATRPNEYPIVFKYGVSSATSATYNGNTALTIYGGASLIAGNSASSTTNATSDTSNTATYINLLTRTGNTSYVVANTIQIKGINAASVSAKNGVISISATNTTYATRPNEYAISFVYGTGSTTYASYTGAAAQTIYGGHKLVVGASTTAIANENTANDTTYLNILTRTTASTWEPSGTGIKFQGSGATSVTSSGGIITISSTNTTYATRPNPAKIYFVNALNTTPTTVSYDGNTAATIQYSDVGAAPLSGINLGAIDWTSGGNDFKLPAKIMPKEALLDLIYVNGTLPTAATGAQAGDIIQTNDNKLYYVNSVTDSGEVETTTEIKVGNSAYASTAGQVNSAFLVYNGSTAIGNGFNGSAAKNVAFYNELIVGGSASAKANATVASNGVFINNLWGMANTNSLAATSAAVAGSVKIVGATGVSVTSSTKGIITVTGTTYATRPNPYDLTVVYGTGSTTAVYSGASALSIYGGSKLITTTANTAVTAATSANTNTYINLLTRVTASTYEVSSSLQIKGSGATTVTSPSTGVIQISSTNTTYATRPNEYGLLIQGGGSNVINYTGASAQTINIAAGTGISVSTASGKISIGATAYTGTSPISISGFTISHADSGVSTGTYGSSASTISIGTGATTTAINIPLIVVNAKGHITSASNKSITFGVSQGLTEGDVVGTVLGKTLYCGVTWDTF